MTAMPLMLGVLCALAISYRYYSAFLAAKVAVLDDSRPTPAVRLNDGQNYHPTNKWVLFGHHFAAISGAGPLVGPVLAAQFGYMPGLLWIVIGVCLAGAVQDFLVMAASIRRNGKSLAQIAASDIGPIAGSTATIAILFIVIIALAGLGKVVVNALGGERVAYPAGSQLVLAAGASTPTRDASGLYLLEPGTILRSPAGSMTFPDKVRIASKTDLTFESKTSAQADGSSHSEMVAAFPADARHVTSGSSWGTFTIAATIPIALFVGWYMYRFRKGKIIEASLIGGGLTLLATFLGSFVSDSPTWSHAFNLQGDTVVWLMAGYGFIASVLPVWVLLVPRDYLSSFLKIGTIAVLVGGVLLANPKMEAPALNHLFVHGGPVVAANIFPFLFITIMCGAISGFHALVSSGTTPKMVRKESDTRTIGYGAMLMEGLVGVVALIAASTLPQMNYYAMNTALAEVPKYHDRIVQVGGGLEHLDPSQDLGLWERRTHETLRGRTGGAVTLAVGMANIFEQASHRFVSATEPTLEALWKYWYHFAVMFEALFILTTIDAGTRIARFLLQEAAGKAIHPKLGEVDWWPGAMVSTGIIVVAWAAFIQYNNFGVIWKMFGIANQMLAVIALAVLTAYLSNEGRRKYLWVTVLPMLFVATTTFTSGALMLMTQVNGLKVQLANAPGTRNAQLIGQACILGGLILAMMIAGAVVMISSAIRVVSTSGEAQTSDRLSLSPVR
jgi:carbon starvation protein